MTDYLHKKYWIGIHGDLDAAITADAPTSEPLNASDFEPVTADEYENTVLDLRYENGEWQP